MTLLLVVVAIGVVLGVAVLVARDQPVLDDDPVDARALRWPPDGDVMPSDLVDARFTVALRGYRMDEVDRVLDDARAALAERDRRITALERAAVWEAPEIEAPEEPTHLTAPADPSGLAAPADPPETALPADSTDPTTLTAPVDMP